MSIVNTTLSSGSPQSVYTSIGNNAVVVVYICNRHDTLSAEVDLHLVPPAASATQDNLIYRKILLAPTDTYVLDTEKLIMNDGASLQASTTLAGNVVVTVNSVGI